jgi:hypothetical protein
VIPALCTRRPSWYANGSGLAILSTHRRPDLVRKRLANTSGDPACVLSSREKIKVATRSTRHGPVGKLAGKQICDPSLRL